MTKLGRQPVMRSHGIALQAFRFNVGRRPARSPACRHRPASEDDGRVNEHRLLPLSSS